MAQPPLTYLETKWQNGYRSNNLITAATQTGDRKNIPMLDRDTHRNITSFGRRVLLTLGRYLYWNVPAVRGTVDEIVRLTVAHYIPQFEGEDQEWGAQVEEWMREHDKIIDVRGAPFNMNTYRRNLVRSLLVDGDRATLLTETVNGYPQIQTFPAHRIGCRNNETTVIGGQFDGARIIDGVICNDYGAAMGYRVLDESASTAVGTYRDVPARDMFLSFVPVTDDQVRGISELGLSAFNWQDADDARKFELLCQKLASSIGLLEMTEEGDANPAQSLIQTAATQNTDGTKATHAIETVDGITVRRFKSGTGSDLKAFISDRPTQNQMAFRDDVIREALHSIGWSFDFSLNPTEIGGAPMRVAVAKINRKKDDIETMAVKPAQNRIDGYRVAKVMDNPERTDKRVVLFKYNPQWYRWGYQGTADVTADAKYDSDVDIAEIRAGLSTKKSGCGRRGLYELDVERDNFNAADRKLSNAGTLAKKHGITIQEALTVLEPPTPNGMQAPAQQAEPAAKGTKE